jgi:hypothetical protein
VRRDGKVFISQIRLDFLSFSLCGEVDVNKGLIILIIVLLVLVFTL